MSIRPHHPLMPEAPAPAVPTPAAPAPADRAPSDCAGDSGAPAGLALLPALRRRRAPKVLLAGFDPGAACDLGAALAAAGRSSEALALHEAIAEAMDDPEDWSALVIDARAAPDAASLDDTLRLLELLAARFELVVANHPAPGLALRTDRWRELRLRVLGDLDEPQWRSRLVELCAAPRASDTATACGGWPGIAACAGESHLKNGSGFLV